MGCAPSVSVAVSFLSEHLRFSFFPSSFVFIFFSRCLLFHSFVSNSLLFFVSSSLPPPSSSSPPSPFPSSSSPPSPSFCWSLVLRPCGFGLLPVFVLCFPLHFSYVFEYIAVIVSCWIEIPTFMLFLTVLPAWRLPVKCTRTICAFGSLLAAYLVCIFGNDLTYRPISCCLSTLEEEQWVFFTDNI